MGSRRAEIEIDVFDYLDVRDYLRDYYAAKKAQGRGFSFRSFSRRAGLASPNHLKRVIDGGRRLTGPMAVRYAAAIGLEGDQAAYFRELAEFSGAATTVARSEAFERLSSFRRVRTGRRLELAQAAYHACWYIPAIRELVSIPGFQEDPVWIAGRMVPTIRAAQAAEALATLLELGLVARGPDGALVQTDTVLSTGAETRGMHIAAYHRSMLERASEAIDLVPREERDISSLTFSAEDAVIADVKQRIQRFRKELIAMLAAHPGGDRVVQLNFQLFPLSKGEAP